MPRLADRGDARRIRNSLPFQGSGNASPPIVGVPVAGEESVFGLPARRSGRMRSVIGEMAHGRAQQQVAAFSGIANNRTAAGLARGSGETAFVVVRHVGMRICGQASGDEERHARPDGSPDAD